MKWPISAIGIISPRTMRSACSGGIRKVRR
jgi:hypothetical protein